MSVPAGPWDPQQGTPEGADAVGFILTEGLVSRDVLFGAGIARDLIGPGDLASLDEVGGDFVPVGVRWVAASPLKVTYLDGTLLEALLSRPELTRRLLVRAAQQASRQAVHRAISQLPRINERLHAFLWMLAERWGRVGPHGIVVPVALTHEALGHMVGARRPTVSLALKELAAAGSVTRRGDGGWVLDPAAAPSHEPSTAVPAPDAVLLADAEAPAVPRFDPAPPQPADGVEALLHRVEAMAAEHVRAQERVRDVISNAGRARARASHTREGIAAHRRDREARRD